MCTKYLRILQEQLHQVSVTSPVQISWGSREKERDRNFKETSISLEMGLFSRGPSVQFTPSPGHTRSPLETLIPLFRLSLLACETYTRYPETTEDNDFLQLLGY